MNHINPDGKDLQENDVEIALLHIYPQYCNHDEAAIVGNHEGLTKLRDAINEALAGPEGGNVAMIPSPGEVFVTDGEGYQVMVIRNDKSWHDPSWNKLSVPYTADEFALMNEHNDAIFPFDLLTEADKDKYYPNRVKDKPNA